MSEEISQNLAGELTQNGHRLFVRVYFEDTDFSGVVYYARYLQFFERGRSDFLRLKGIFHHQLFAGDFGEPLYFVVKSIHVDFALPARIDDVLCVETEVSDQRGVRLLMHQKISRDGVVIASADVTIVLLNTDGKPRRLPASLAELLLN